MGPSPAPPAVPGLPQDQCEAMRAGRVPRGLSLTHWLPPRLRKPRVSFPVIPEALGRKAVTGLQFGNGGDSTAWRRRTLWSPAWGVLPPSCCVALAQWPKLSEPSFPAL